MAQRHSEFLDAGARVYAISADTAPQNAAMVEKLALPFPLLADPTRDEAITPLGFADENDPRQISRPSTAIVATNGEVVYSVTGRDYADRPNEDDLLEVVRELALPATTQERPEVGQAEDGPKAMPFDGLMHYFRGAKFATMALRGRHRDLGEDFRDDTKRYVQMVERYLEAMTSVEDRRA